MRISRQAKHLLLVLGLLTLLIWAVSPNTTRIDPDEEVAFFGSYVFWDAAGDLKVVLYGRVFEPERSSSVRRAAIDRLISPGLFRYMDKRPIDFDGEACDLMHERLAPFLYDGESRAGLGVRVRGAGGEAVLQLPRTAAGGYFAVTTTEVGNRAVAELVGGGAELCIDSILPRADRRRFDTRLPVPPSRLPFLVISDVDDTIRIADVTNRRAMIERVFLRPYAEVPGMCAIYRALSERGAWFHYVSGSPWQLEPVMRQFIAAAQFPPGPLHCRQINWDFWNNDPLDLEEFKVTTIERLLEQHASSPVLLIGDSGEFDPEVYTAVARAHSSRVVGIWIRKVGNSWDAARLADAERLVDAERVIAFADTNELEPALEKTRAALRPHGK